MYIYASACIFNDKTAYTYKVLPGNYFGYLSLVFKRHCLILALFFAIECRLLSADHCNDVKVTVKPSFMFKYAS